jgi:hypothetical protein
MSQSSPHVALPHPNCQSESPGRLAQTLVIGGLRFPKGTCRSWRLIPVGLETGMVRETMRAAMSCRRSVPSGDRRIKRATVSASLPKGFCDNRRALPCAGLRPVAADGKYPCLRTWSTTPIMSSDDAQVASSALRVPPLQFDQHWPQPDAIGRASHESGFGNRADKHRRIATLGCPTEPVPEFGVGAYGVQIYFTSQTDLLLPRQNGVTVSVTVKGEKGLFLINSWVRRCCKFNDLACWKYAGTD